MLILLKEIQESKNHWFEIEIYKDNGFVQLQLLESKECDSYQEVLDSIFDLDRQDKISYRDLDLDYNNKKVKNIKNLNDLISSIEENRL